MQLQSTDWLAEYCAICVSEGTFVHVLTDSEEMTQAIAEKTVALLRSVKFSVEAIGFTLFAIPEGWGYPHCSRMFIKLIESGKLISWIFSDWVGVYNGHQIDKKFSQRILGRAPNQAWQHTYDLHTESYLAFS